MRFKCVKCECIASVKKVLRALEDEAGYEYTKPEKEDVFICPACGDMMLLKQ